MIVTVNTDASYHPIHKVGAYAFWIICDQERIAKSGVLKEAKNSTDAELKCIANALYTLLHSDINGISKIIINSDAKTAFEKVGRKKKDLAGRTIGNLLRQLKDKHFPARKITQNIHEFRHVKAHVKIESARSWVNDWCDKEAKKALRQIVNQQLHDKDYNSRKAKKDSREVIFKMDASS